MGKYMDKQIRENQAKAKESDKGKIKYFSKCFSFHILTIFLLLFFSATIPAHAENETKSFFFELTVDGKEEKRVEPGDIITVVLKLKRTDSSEPYTMYAMQDEIRYDSTFFELVEGSAILNNGIVSTDIGMIDRYREFYMNYLSMSGGNQWEENMLIGSFQLKVIGTSGVTKITNEDYLVSVMDGSDRYRCEANEITVILSSECTVSFETNGGSEIEDQVIRYGEKIPLPVETKREGYELEGWYKDIHLKERWDFDKDTVEGNLMLYAKWIVNQEGNKNDANKPLIDWWLWTILLVVIILFFIWRKKKKRSR